MERNGYYIGYMVLTFLLLSTASLAQARQSTVIFTDDFDVGILDPAWTITFDHADAWDFDESITQQSHLTVRDITGPTSLANLWRRVFLNRAIPVYW